MARYVFSKRCCVQRFCSNSSRLEDAVSGNILCNTRPMHVGEKKHRVPRRSSHCHPEPGFERSILHTPISTCRKVKELNTLQKLKRARGGWPCIRKCYHWVFFCPSSTRTRVLAWRHTPKDVLHQPSINRWR